MSEGTIIGPDGTPATVHTVIIDKEDAELLRKYKKFLNRYGLKEAVYCQHCWEELGQSLAGTEFHVTGTQILCKCRHRMLFYQGSTF